MLALCARTVYGVRMETETWCSDCEDWTETDRPGLFRRFCARCGMDRDN